jgi:hypothetical protein
MLYFCTLFDANYLSRGIATYQSLVKTGEKFHLYVVAFDDDAFEVLQQLNYTNLTPISLADFEDEALLAVKPSRTRAEYCWTSTSSLILYCIQKFSLSHCTYIDADMFFFQKPSILLAEMGEKSVLITEHRYTKRYDQAKKSGIYCVQFMYFRNDERGMNVLNWWRERCLEWCFNRHEDGKFGDQKYLDDWTTCFEGVHVLRHEGGGLAPWNVQQYNFFLADGGILKGQNRYTKIVFDAVFFHFHGVRLFEKSKYILSPKKYLLSESVLTYFYEPYLKILNVTKSQIDNISTKRDWNGTQSYEAYQQAKNKGWVDFFYSNTIKRFF